MFWPREGATGSAGKIGARGSGNFFYVGLGMNISCVKQILQHVREKICILALNSPIKKSLLPRGAPMPVVLYGWTHVDLPPSDVRLRKYVPP